jgi:hypothetical protein
MKPSEIGSSVMNNLRYRSAIAAAIFAVGSMANSAEAQTAFTPGNVIVSRSVYQVLPRLSRLASLYRQYAR